MINTARRDSPLPPLMTAASREDPKDTFETVLSGLRRNIPRPSAEGFQPPSAFLHARAPVPKFNWLQQ